MSSFYQQSMDAFERQLIQRALQQHGGNQTQAARALGITYRQLRLRIEKLGLREKPYQLKAL